MTEEEKRKELVVPPWFIDLPIMQQSILMQATRGPDGVRKDHPIKNIHRVYRAAVLKAGYYGRMLEVGEAGDDFMSLEIFRFGSKWEDEVRDFFLYRDELPFHYVDHLRRAAQIVAYMHPNVTISQAFTYFYMKFCKMDSVKPETKAEMNRRLNDNDQELWT